MLEVASGDASPAPFAVLDEPEFALGELTFTVPVASMNADGAWKTLIYAHLGVERERSSDYSGG